MHKAFVKWSPSERLWLLGTPWVASPCGDRPPDIAIAAADALDVMAVRFYDLQRHRAWATAMEALRAWASRL